MKDIVVARKLRPSLPPMWANDEVRGYVMFGERVWWAGRGECECTCISMHHLHVMSEIPYSGKFSRGPIFAVFTVDSWTVKIRSVKWACLYMHVLVRLHASTKVELQNVRRLPIHKNWAPQKFSAIFKYSLSPPTPLSKFTDTRAHVSSYIACLSLEGSLVHCTRSAGTHYINFSPHTVPKRTVWDASGVLGWGSRG